MTDAFIEFNLNLERLFETLTDYNGDFNINVHEKPERKDYDGEREYDFEFIDAEFNE